MAGLADIDALSATHALTVFGAFHPGPDDGAPDGCGTLVLLAPQEPGFWPHFTAQPEFADGACDPLDRWSKRALGGLAETLGAQALFPSDGPPYRPFFRWALATGAAWPSPISLMVHHRMGLWASIRGALALPERLDLPPPPQQPCAGCTAQPCRYTCPVDAFVGGQYNTDACHAHLNSPAGHECLSHGCRARSICPVSKSYGRMPEQSAFHMAAFHP